MGERLPPLTARAVHICVDMRRLFSPAGPWSTPWMPKVLPQCVALSAHCPDATIFTRFITPQTEDDARGAWRALNKRWPETTQQRIHPDLLELMPELARFTPRRGCSTSPYTLGSLGSGSSDTSRKSRLTSSSFRVRKPNLRPVDGVGSRGLWLSCCDSHRRGMQLLRRGARCPTETLS